MTKPWRPANGFEFDCFQEHFCERCVSWTDEQCNIPDRAFWNQVEEPDYPKEWVEVNGEADCTAFKKADA